MSCYFLPDLMTPVYTHLACPQCCGAEPRPSMRIVKVTGPMPRREARSSKWSGPFVNRNPSCRAPQWAGPSRQGAPGEEPRTAERIGGNRGTDPRRLRRFRRAISRQSRWRRSASSPQVCRRHRVIPEWRADRRAPDQAHRSQCRFPPQAQGVAGYRGGRSGRDGGYVVGDHGMIYRYRVVPTAGPQKNRRVEIKIRTS